MAYYYKLRMAKEGRILSLVKKSLNNKDSLNKIKTKIAVALFQKELLALLRYSY